MFEFLAQLFDTTDFPARWHCGTWTAAHGWLHILSDLGVWSAYVAIPCVLIFFTLRRRDLPFRNLFLLFGGFILACGTTHLMEAILFWWPAYRLAGLIKFATAIVSWTTVIALVPIIPKALALRSPLDLEREIAHRKRAEESLQRAHDELERRVQERTAIILDVNASLQAEITERKLAEEAAAAKTRAIALSNAELIRSNQELDDFAYIASHDLKEPLRGIFNYSTFLIEDYSDKLDDDGRGKLHTLQHLCKRLDAFIDALLEFSRLGRVDLAIHETDLNEVLAGVLDSLYITLQERAIEVRVPRDLPTMRCDHVRIAEVFRNLISNAMKYNDKPRKWIEIGCSDEPATGSREHEMGAASARPPTIPVFHVRDNGIGIREQHQQSIFRIFKRLHGRDKYGGGTGAGLTIVKKIVERHDGRIWVESTYGEGSTFYFTLQRGIEK